jgi:dipeptide transport system ATP-binding protein
MKDEPVLVANNLSKHYSIAQGSFKPPIILKALNNASFSLNKRKTLAIVGESGCGKTTLAQLVAMINTPTEGSLCIAGKEVMNADKGTLQSLRSTVQIVFQNPYGSLNPRQKVGAALMEPLRMNTRMAKDECQSRARDMLDKVGLRPEHFDRYPHMFSGGQRQRIAIARALMLEPEIIVLDEPVSALDISIQAQVLNLLAQLQDEQDLAYLFITHDLSVVKHIADEVMVMYLGKPVEHRPSKALFEDPQHPYTRALLSATPIPIPGAKKRRTNLVGEIPSPLDPPTGCYFHPRCPMKFAPCDQDIPKSLSLGENAGKVACHAVSDTA